MQKNQKIKVLLVDDEETFARALSERLSSRGVAAKAAFGGKEALELIDREEPDVMLLDLRMPEIDGMEVLRRIRRRYPNIQTIILSGYGSDSARKEAARLGAVDFLDKPADSYILAEKIRSAFAVKQCQRTLYTYGGFVPILRRHFAHEGIILGENALGIKCFCRDDNQDQLGYLLMNTGRNAGWFDLNAFGAFPAGRSAESLEPPSHHIPELQNDAWTVVFHATHVGCDSTYTLGKTDRYGMRQPSSSCGLIAAILNRHNDRRQGTEPPAFKDFEMAAAERALMVHLDDILSTPHPMASAAEKLFDLGSGIFEGLLMENGGRYFYIGGINVDYDAKRPENNFFIPKTLCIYENAVKRELDIQ